MGGDDDATAAGRCAAADVHPFLCAVAHRTGDLSLLRDEFAPDQGQLLVPGCGLGPEERSAARALAAAALADHLASGRPDHRLTPEERRRIFGFLVGARRRRALGSLLDRGARTRGERPAGAVVAQHRRSTARSAAPSSGRGRRAWPRRTVSVRPAWRSPCSRRTTTWAGPGSRTSTRAAGSTSPISSTASPSPRPTTGSPASRPSPTCWPTCRRRPRTSGWGSASASGAR